MLLNHARQTPRDWDDAAPSYCPDCGSALLPRRGRLIAWHWSHRPSCDGATGRACLAEETAWHLVWKSVYHGFDGWEVEVPFVVDGERFRLDAARLDAGKAREFIHTLSDAYLHKHAALRASGLDVLWIYDGGRFAAARARPVAGGGLRHLLKPLARHLHAQVGGLAHHDGRLWREWRGDVWYPAEGETITKLASLFEAEQARVQADAAAEAPPAGAELDN
jgi:hypothetical protein